MLLIFNWAAMPILHFYMILEQTCKTVDCFCYWCQVGFNHNHLMFLYDGTSCMSDLPVCVSLLLVLITCNSIIRSGEQSWSHDRFTWRVRLIAKWTDSRTSLSPFLPLLSFFSFSSCSCCKLLLRIDFSLNTRLLLVKQMPCVIVKCYLRTKGMYTWMFFPHVIFSFVTLCFHWRTMC